MRLPVVNGQDDTIDEPTATQMLRYAIDQGVNYIDTAYPYHKGMSEPFVGRALNNGYRDKVFLATKLPSWEVQTPEDCERILSEQLQRLLTEKIDFYLLHALKKDWWEKLKSLGVLEFLDQAKREGRISYLGFSFHDEAEQFKTIVDEYDWSFCQIQYNFMDEETQAGREGLHYAAEKELAVVIMEPLRSGNLARETPNDIGAIWEQASVTRTPAECALRWVCDHPQVSVVLSGMTTPEQVEENCRIASLAEPNSLTADEHEIINKVKNCYRSHIVVDCTGCGYCMPCPSGGNIPRIFSIINDRSIHGDKRWSHLMYTFASNEGEQATSCSECGECEEVCPQAIPIIATLKRCHNLLNAPTEE